MRSVAAFVVYQACWWACVLGAGSSWAVAGIAGTIAFAVWHVRGATDPVLELRVVLTAVVVGTAVDSALVISGAIHFGDAVSLGPFPTPLWMIALWMGFGVTLTSSFRFVLASWYRAACFGLIVGPLTYLGGARLVDFKLGSPLWASALVVGVGWALAMGALRSAAQSRPFSEAPPRRRS